MGDTAYLGTTSTAPGTASNWTNGIPTDGNTVDIDGRAQNDLAGADQSTIEPSILRVYRNCLKSIGTNALGTVTPWDIGPLICHIGLPSEGGNQTGPPFVALDFNDDPVECTVHYARTSGPSG